MPHVPVFQYENVNGTKYLAYPRFFLFQFLNFLIFSKEVF